MKQRPHASHEKRKERKNASKKFKKIGIGTAIVTCMTIPIKAHSQTSPNYCK
jgi:hypothetical protein